MSERDLNKEDLIPATKEDEEEMLAEEERETEETQEMEKSDTVSGDTEKKEPFSARWKRRLPILAIYLRYLLPAFTVVFSLIYGFFYNVEFLSGGATGELSINRLYVNTFVGMHNYFGGATSAGRTSFYVLLTLGAAVGILLFLVAAFYAFLAAITAVRAFRYGYESEESDRMKLIFKVAFPGRKTLFFTNLLILIPLWYPHYFSMIGRHFLAIGGEDVIFVLHNSPLVVAGVLLALTLLLALIIPRFERRKKMNMFLLHHPIKEKTEKAEEETAEEIDETDE